MPQTQDISIRYVREEDYPEVLELTKKLVKVILPDEDFEEDKIRRTFNSALENDKFTGIILTVDGQVKGFIFGFITEQYFHSTLIAYCMAIYVTEDSRKYGLEMIKSFESWGRYRKAKTLCISSFTNLSPKNISTLYKRLGYEEKEIIHWKEV